MIHLIVKGLLCVTFTDAAVLAEASAKGVCYSRYGACVPRKHGLREAGIRALLHSISHISARYRLTITPLLSLFSDFYFRLFILVKKSPKECPELIGKTALVVSCANCQFHFMQKLNTTLEQPIIKCPICEGRLKLVGPLWSEEIHSPIMLDSMLEELKQNMPKTGKKILGLLTAMKEEVSANLPPLGYYMSTIASEIRGSEPGYPKIIGALHSLNYIAMQSAMEPKCIKTTAPIEILYDVMKHYKKTYCSSMPFIPPTLDPKSYQYKILSREIKLPKEPIYKPLPGMKNRIPRYFPNPEPNWGPKQRAHGVKR